MSEKKNDKGPDYIIEPLRSLAVPIEGIKTDAANARIHGEANLQAIRASLSRFGQQKPIVVDTDNMVIAGNGTLTAARRLGWKQIAVVRSDLTGRDRKAFAIFDNRSAELAEWESSLLNEQLTDLASSDAALLASMSYEDVDLRKMLDDASAQIIRSDIKEIEIVDPPSMMWIMLGIPVDEFGRARDALITLESLADVKVEVARHEKTP